MTKTNQSGNVVSIDEQDDGSTIIGIDSRKTDGNGTPSFKVSYHFPAGSDSPVPRFAADWR